MTVIYRKYKQYDSNILILLEIFYNYAITCICVCQPCSSGSSFVYVRTYMYYNSIIIIIILHIILKNYICIIYKML